MTDDYDLLASFYCACQGQGAHRAAGRPRDYVSRVPQPDELFSRNAEDLWQERIEPDIDAGKCDERKRVLKISRMQAGVGVASKSLVISINDGFEQTHGLV